MPIHIPIHDLISVVPGRMPGVSAGAAGNGFGILCVGAEV